MHIKGIKSLIDSSNPKVKEHPAYCDGQNPFHLSENPEFLKTPIIRMGRRIIIGFDEKHLQNGYLKGGIEMKRTTAIMLAVILVAAIAIGALISQKNTLVSEKDTLAQQVETLTGEVDSLNAKLKADEEEAKKLGDIEAEKEKIAEEKKTLEEKITELEEAAKANEESLKKLTA